jgi:hypothetical protein
MEQALQAYHNIMTTTQASIRMHGSIVQYLEVEVMTAVQLKLVCIEEAC